VSDPPTPDEAGLTIVRSSRVTFADGLVLDDASEISCGCILGTRVLSGTKGMILRACPNPACPVLTYFTKTALAKRKPLAFGASKADLDSLLHKFTSGGPSP
jgi:hypothetical protein